MNGVKKTSFSGISKNGNSIVEVIVTLIIVTFGVLGAYGLIHAGQNLAIATENRIQATSIAREWLEIVQNIRDTNWIKFSSDYENCWKTNQYDAGCIGNESDTSIYPDGCYRALNTAIDDTSDTTAWQWYLDRVDDSYEPSPTYTLANSSYRIYINDTGLTTQNGPSDAPICSKSRTTACNTVFVRQICLHSIDRDHLDIVSSVQWSDSSRSSGFYEIRLPMTLTNWIKKR